MSSPLPGVTPRWEWRGFGDRVAPAVDLLSSLEPERRQQSDDRYVLSRHSDASVKVRDGVMDVKQLFEVDDAGLERWAPTLKADFPMSGDEVAQMLTALRIEATLDPTRAYTFADLTAECFGDDTTLVVDVHKVRTHYVVQGCMVESTEMTAGGSTIRTVGIESTDAAQVLEVLGWLGLTGSANECVARGIKSLVGFGSSRLLVLDVGTNSVKYHLVDLAVDGSTRTLADRAEVTRLGEGQADSGELADEAIARTVAAVEAMVETARAEGPVDIVAVGTAGLRRAPNRSVFVDAVRDRAGVEVEVITGEEEARLAYLAATSALPAARGSLTVFDSGGGSTQFTFGRDEQVDEQFSVDVGAVRIAERFGLADATSSATLGEALDALARQLDVLDERARPDGIVAIGGTATNIAAVSHALTTYDPDIVHGTVLDLAELDRQIELYRTRTAEERRSIAGLQPQRAEVILGGACIVKTILTKLDHDTMTVSDRGLRHGVVIDRLASGVRGR